MNFGFTEEQNLLKDQVQRFMKEACPMTRVREISASENAFDRTLWQQAADLGWLGLTIPESYGGLGLKWIDLIVVLEAAAEGLSPLPIASHALATSAIVACASDEQKARWLPAMASGEAVVTLGLYDEANWIDPAAITARATVAGGKVSLQGKKPFVNDALAADYLLLAVQGPDGLALAAVGRDQVQVAAQPTIDSTKPMASVDLTGAEIDAAGLLPLSPEQLAFLTDCGGFA
ncbi:MAG: hypothetical protein CMQ13_06835, partial [Gammaproteobacteria bacterium]|nr:hypothetical protein [Gammaproteobacteria bacterium]